jgi:hypothetical protein
MVDNYDPQFQGWVQAQREQERHSLNDIYRSLYQIRSDLKVTDFYDKHRTITRMGYLLSHVSDLLMDIDKQQIEMVEPAMKFYLKSKRSVTIE